MQLSPAAGWRSPTGAGGWRTVIADMGVPAGTAEADARRSLSGALPAGVRQVRITTTAAVYFDQILVGDIAEDAVAVHRRGFEAADLHWRGYPEHTSIKGTFAFRYHYDRLDPYTDWGTHAGAFTRFGPVSDLLGEVDDRFVIMGHGDELTMEVAANAFPPPAEGHEQDLPVLLRRLRQGHGLPQRRLPHGRAAALPRHEQVPVPGDRVLPGDPRSTSEYVLEYNTRRVAGYYE